MTMGGFDAWCSKVVPELAKVRETLDKKLEDNLVVLGSYSDQIRSHLARAVEIHADAGFYLEQAEHRVLLRKGEGSDLDRKTKQKADTAQERRIFRMAEGFLKALHAVLIEIQSRRRAIEKEYGASRSAGVQ